MCREPIPAECTSLGPVPAEPAAPEPASAEPPCREPIPAEIPPRQAIPAELPLIEPAVAPVDGEVAPISADADAPVFRAAVPRTPASRSDTHRPTGTVVVLRVVGWSAVTESPPPPCVPWSGSLARACARCMSPWGRATPGMRSRPPVPRAPCRPRQVARMRAMAALHRMAWGGSGSRVTPRRRDSSFRVCYRSAWKGPRRRRRVPCMKRQGPRTRR